MHFLLRHAHSRVRRLKLEVLIGTNELVVLRVLNPSPQLAPLVIRAKLGFVARLRIITLVALIVHTHSRSFCRLILRGRNCGRGIELAGQHASAV